jgi:hypothetical protein
MLLAFVPDPLWWSVGDPHPDGSETSPELSFRASAPTDGARQQPAGASILDFTNAQGQRATLQQRASAFEEDFELFKKLSRLRCWCSISRSTLLTIAAVG